MMNARIIISRIPGYPLDTVLEFVITDRFDNDRVTYRDRFLIKRSDGKMFTTNCPSAVFEHFSNAMHFVSEEIRILHEWKR